VVPGLLPESVRLAADPLTFPEIRYVLGDGDGDDVVGVNRTSTQ